MSYVIPKTDYDVNSKSYYLTVTVCVILPAAQELTVDFKTTSADFDEATVGGVSYYSEDFTQVTIYFIANSTLSIMHCTAVLFASIYSNVGIYNSALIVCTVNLYSCYIFIIISPSKCPSQEKHVKRSPVNPLILTPLRNTSGGLLE